MKPLAALDAGFTGAASLTLVHEFIKRTLTDAPRMDLLGMNALAKTFKVPYSTIKNNPNVFDLTLLGEIITNSIYYSITATGDKNVLSKGFTAGALAGVAAAVLPEHLGLNKNYSNRTRTTTALTIGLYTLGGIIAAYTYKRNINRKALEQKKSAEKKLKELKDLKKRIQKISNH